MLARIAGASEIGGGLLWPPLWPWAVTGPGSLSVDGLTGANLPRSLHRLVAVGAVATSAASQAMVLRTPRRPFPPGGSKSAGTLQPTWAKASDHRRRVVASGGFPTPGPDDPQERWAPQLSNVLYKLLYDTERLIQISTTADQAKARNLGRDPRAPLLVAGENFWQFAVAEATASLRHLNGDGIERDL